MKIKELTTYLETIAPSSYQESYDNSGLIVGYGSTEITGVLLCLDSTEAIVDEAMELGCNLIIAHHPIVFKGLKRFNGNNYIERTVIKAIKNNIAIYAIHTNLDNVYQQGVNTKIAALLGLENTRILSPKANLQRITASINADNVESVQAAISALSVHHQSMNGTQIEVLCDKIQQGAVIKALSTNDYAISSVDNKNPLVGSGMIGDLAEPMDTLDFLKMVKSTMKVGALKHTNILKGQVKRIAVCGGSGGFLLRKAIGGGADVFITADYKYHEFFDADGRIIIADIGHFESEQFTIDLLFDIISQKFSNFALHCTKVTTNPVNYL